MTAPFYEVEHSEVIIVIGANPTENHPVAATFFKNAAKKGSKLIVMDPRGHALKKHATHMLQFKPGSDVALLNSIMHVIIEDGLFNDEYIKKQTSGFDDLRRHLKNYPPEIMEEQTGIDANLIREVDERSRSVQADEDRHTLVPERCSVSRPRRPPRRPRARPRAIRTTTRMKCRRRRPDVAASRRGSR